MNPHILKRIEAYLIMRLMDVPDRSREWYSYHDALAEVEAAEVKMNEAFEIEWEKMKA